MSKATDKSAAFLQALSSPPAEPPKPPNISEPAELATPARAMSRIGLKHIGGYFDRADVEKIAVLRARLGLDNSQLIRLAVDELYKKHEAKRAFGDA
jgi:hypothetical protein